MRFADGTLNPVFRRRSESAPVADPTPRPGKPGGKGRPTPKRREAEKRRRRPITAPKDRKEAYRTMRARQAKERARAKEGMARGDDKYLPKRDRGPVRGFARDYVDARRTVGSYLMWVLFALFGVSLLPVQEVRLLVPLTFPLLLGIALFESLFIALRVSTLAAQRFPDENIKGVGLYAAVRSMQIRRLRIPDPRLRPGERDKV